MIGRLVSVGLAGLCLMPGQAARAQLPPGWMEMAQLAYCHGVNMSALSDLQFKLLTDPKCAADDKSCVATRTATEQARNDFATHVRRSMAQLKEQGIIKDGKWAVTQAERISASGYEEQRACSKKQRSDCRGVESCLREQPK